MIIPTGGTEQNGPHMVLGKHNWLVKYKAGEVAQAPGRRLVAPVVAYVPEGEINPPTGHMRFPGTITTPQDVYAKVLEFAARSFRQHGFKEIAFLGDSGGNQAGQKLVADALNKEWAVGRRPRRSLERLLSGAWRRLVEVAGRVGRGRGFAREHPRHGKPAAAQSVDDPQRQAGAWQAQ